MRLDIFFQRSLTKSEPDIIRVLLLLALLAPLPFLLFYWESGSDAGAYYIPMVRAFANADFVAAFHPMIPPLQPVLAGLIASFPLVSPFFALQLVSVAFFAATAPILYLLILRLFSSTKTALGSSLLFIACPKIIKHAGYGELDSGKMFFLVLVVYLLALLWEEVSLRKVVFFAIALAGLTLIRGEGLFFSFLAITFLLLSVFRGPVIRNIVFFAGCLFLFLLLIAPWVRYEYEHAGFPVTDSRQIPHLKKYLPSFIEFGFVNNSPIVIGELKALDEIANKINLSQSFEEAKPFTENQTRKKYWNSILSGMVKLYIPFLIIGVVAIVREKFQGKEVNHKPYIIFFCLFSINLLFFVLINNFNFIACRYVMHGSLFLLPFVWAGFSRVVGVLPDNLKNRFVVMSALVFILSGNERVIGSIIKNFTNNEQKNYFLTAQWIDNNRVLALKKTPLKSTLSRYHTGLTPVVAFGHRRTAGFVESDLFFLKDFARGKYVPVSLFKEIVELKNIHFVVSDKYLNRYNENFSRLDIENDFVQCKSFGSGDDKVTVYGYLPHLIADAKDVCGQ